MTEQQIYETKVEIVVYSRGPIDHNPPGADDYGRTLIGDIVHEMNDGDMIGDYTVGESVAVPHDELAAKLEAIGGEMSFFFDEDEDGG